MFWDPADAGGQICSLLSIQRRSAAAGWTLTKHDRRPRPAPVCQSIKHLSPGRVKLWNADSRRSDTLASTDEDSGGASCGMRTAVAQIHCLAVPPTLLPCCGMRTAVAQIHSDAAAYITAVAVECGQPSLRYTSGFHGLHHCLLWNADSRRSDTLATCSSAAAMCCGMRTAVAQIH